MLASLETPGIATAPPATPPLARATTTRQLAEIAPVPKGEAQKVLTSFHIGIAAGLTLLPIPAGLVGGLGGLGLAAWLSMQDPTLAGVVCAAAVLCAVGSVIVLLRYQQLLPGRYMRWVARRVFARRRTPLVQFDDEGVEFLDVVPRSNWGRTMLEPATDIGLLRIDRTAREVLFEGDARRYRIPFESVRGCHVEEIRMDADQWGNDLYYATVLAFESATGVREMPLCGRHLTLTVRRMAHRRAQAELLCQALQQALAS
jgi:hypothetical protein